MDLVLNAADSYLLTPYVYPSWWKEDDVTRQLFSLFAIVVIGGYVMYLSLATLSYYFIFDHKLFKHPKMLKVSIFIKRIYKLSLRSTPTL
jgi:lathosterol oxidase